ncbi:MAG: uL15m family ribosomal protein [Promethearchaeota archaeon]
MTMKFPRECRRRRGQRTHGYGRIGAHRKSGQRGGKGLTTGKFKHMWTYTVKQRSLGWPDPRWRIGKQGFTRPQVLRRLGAINTINVKDLDLKLDNLVESGIATKTGKSAYKIDLAAMNVRKLLGSGEISKKVEVTVEKASPRAVEKIEAAGGKVNLAQ